SPRAGQLPVEQTREQSLGAHGLSARFLLRAVAASSDLKSIDVAADERESFHFGLVQTPFDGCFVTDFDFMKGDVSERFHKLSLPLAGIVPRDPVIHGRAHQAAISQRVMTCSMSDSWARHRSRKSRITVLWFGFRLQYNE